MIHPDAPVSRQVRRWIARHPADSRAKHPYGVRYTNAHTFLPGLHTRTTAEAVSVAPLDVAVIHRAKAKRARKRERYALTIPRVGA